MCTVNRAVNKRVNYYDAVWKGGQSSGGRVGGVTADGKNAERINRKSWNFERKQNGQTWRTKGCGKEIRKCEKKTKKNVTVDKTERYNLTDDQLIHNLEKNFSEIFRNNNRITIGSALRENRTGVSCGEVTERTCGRLRCVELRDAGNWVLGCAKAPDIYLKACLAMYRIISPQCPDVDIAHASFGVVRLEIAGLGGIDDAIQSTFHLNTFTRLDSQVSVRLEPVICTRYQYTWQQYTETLYGLPRTKSLSFHQILTDVQNPFTAGLSNKFETRRRSW